MPRPISWGSRRSRAEPRARPRARQLAHRAQAFEGLLFPLIQHDPGAGLPGGIARLAGRGPHVAPQAVVPISPAWQHEALPRLGVATRRIQQQRLLRHIARAFAFVLGRVASRGIEVEGAPDGLACAPHGRARAPASPSRVACTPAGRSAGATGITTRCLPTLRQVLRHLLAGPRLPRPALESLRRREGGLGRQATMERGQGHAQSPTCGQELDVRIVSRTGLHHRTPVLRRF